MEDEIRGRLESAAVGECVELPDGSQVVKMASDLFVPVNGPLFDDESLWE